MKLDPTGFTEREKEIAREGYNRGYRAAEKFWANKTAIIRRAAADLARALEETS